MGLFPGGFFPSFLGFFFPSFLNGPMPLISERGSQYLAFGMLEWYMEALFSMVFFPIFFRVFFPVFFEGGSPYLFCFFFSHLFWGSAYTHSPVSEVHFQ